ncbi:hypothetical protein C5167_030969 [Papaver somniferum]|nr:hypothetical protein C5167_030969 [Papaver somniferum]
MPREQKLALQHWLEQRAVNHSSTDFEGPMLEMAHKYRSLQIEKESYEVVVVIGKLVYRQSGMC